MKKFQFIIYDANEKSKVIQTIQLQTNREYSIGRQGSKADIQIDGSNTVSRNHAKIIVGNTSATLQDLGSVNGTFKNNVQVQPNQTIILRKGIEIKFAEAPYICEVESIELDQDELTQQETLLKMINSQKFNEKSRSRSRSNEKKKFQSQKDDKRKLLWQAKDTTVIKKDNQIWNMGNLSDGERLKMMKLMGVKEVQIIQQIYQKKSHIQDQSDLSKEKITIEKRNKELEKQFLLAKTSKNKFGLGI